MTHMVQLQETPVDVRGLREELATRGNRVHPRPRARGSPTVTSKSRRRRESRKPPSSRKPGSQAALADVLEREAESIVRLVPRPYPRGDKAIAIAFAHRGIALWRSHRLAVKGPSIAAVHVIGRTLAELPIRLSWLYLRPELHLLLWEAEYARHQVAIYKAMPNTWVGTVVGAMDMANTRRTFFDDAVSKARERLVDAVKAGEPVLGVGEKGALVPSIDDMVTQLEKAGKTGGRDIYELSIRTDGDWIHSGGGSFLRMIAAGDTVENDEQPAKSSAAYRLESLGNVMSLIWIADEIAQLGLHDRCKQFFERYAASAISFAQAFADTVDRADPWWHITDDQRQILELPTPGRR